ncbi:unnamed protein product [Symbiodinium natans]|uniref:Uncharacterized protein n=1 Tax=Symbiodinium natans TaxID=878477 RepID=A0A812IYG9_9DINO|nr:unnamed protein product [Symbiodinium natans]
MSSGADVCDSYARHAKHVDPFSAFPAAVGGRRDEVLLIMEETGLHVTKPIAAPNVGQFFLLIVFELLSGSGIRSVLQGRPIGKWGKWAGGLPRFDIFPHPCAAACDPHAEDMAERLAAALNAAIVNIRQRLGKTQLLSTGEYTKAGDDRLVLTLEAVEWGFVHTLEVNRSDADLCCGGKTKSRKHIGEALKTNDHHLRVFATPEIATVLFKQGAMSDGSFAGFVAEEYTEFVIQSAILQFVFEGIWAQGAALSLHSSDYAVLMTDRDALDGRSYTRHFHGPWPHGLRLDGPGDAKFQSCFISCVPILGRLLDETGKRIHIPSLVESDLARRYEIGAVFWHSLADTNGKLNVSAYDRRMKPSRHESAQQAFYNDVNASEAFPQCLNASVSAWRCVEVYEDGYPSDRIIWIVDFVQERLYTKEDADPSLFSAYERQVQPWSSEAFLMFVVMVFVVPFQLAPPAACGAKCALVDIAGALGAFGQAFASAGIKAMLQYFLADTLKQFLPPNRDTFTAMQLAPDDIKYVGYLAPDKEKSPIRLTEWVVLGPVSEVMKYDFKNQCEVYAVNPCFRQWQKDVDKVIPLKDIHVGVVASGTAKRLGKKIFIQGLAQVSAALTADGRAILVCDEEDEEVLGGKLEDILEAQEWKAQSQCLRLCVLHTHDVPDVGEVQWLQNKSSPSCPD